MSDQLTVNPTSCTVRHIKRCLSTDDGAVLIGRVYFRADITDGQNGMDGRGGWIDAEVARVLSDDGSLKLRLPNAPGADGVLHRKRFAAITDHGYRIGEEWIEVRREAGKVIAVATPATYTIDKDTVTLNCVDPLALTTLARDEALNPWCASPRDVLEYYGRLEMPWILRDFTDWNLTGGGTTSDGWSYLGASPVPGAARISGANAKLQYTAVTPPASAQESWSAQLTGTLVAGGFGFNVFGATLAVDLTNGWVRLNTDASIDREVVKRTDLIPGAPFTLRLYQRGEWIFAQVNGETVDVGRMVTGPAYPYVTTVTGGTVDVKRFTVTTTERFLSSTSELGDLILPGAPTPGGLSAKYFLESTARSQAAGNTTKFDEWALSPLQDEYADRTDGPIAFTATNPPAWQPAGPSGGQWWTVRWTGAIYLGLASADAKLRATIGAGNRLKMWVGRTGPGVSPLLNITATTSTAFLRSVLGSVDGWYPIIIELYTRTGASGVTLEDSPNGTVWTTVPADRLSPYGIVDDQVQHESHRSMIDSITQAWGYQWSVEPRSLESGSFPGRLIPRVRQGRDTAKVIRAPQGTSIQVSATAADSIDRLLIDAAGINKPDGAASLTGEGWNTAAALGHLFISTGWEAAPEITEGRLLEQRALSLMALRSGPLAQVQLNADGDTTLVDTFPLTGALARMNWEPGDGARLVLSDYGLVDQTPRQMTVVSWMCHPDGIGPPQITWRQTPLGARDFLASVQRSVASGHRNYQGQISEVPGSPASNMPGWAAGPMSWLSTAGRIVQLRVHVLTLTGGSITPVVNGHTGLAIDAPGKYPIDALTDPSSAQQATFTPSAAGVQYIAQLAATVAL